MSNDDHIIIQIVCHNRGLHVQSQWHIRAYISQSHNHNSFSAGWVCGRRYPIASRQGHCHPKLLLCCSVVVWCLEILSGVVFSRLILAWLCRLEVQLLRHHSRAPLWIVIIAVSRLTRCVAGGWSTLPVPQRTILTRIVHISMYIIYS